MQLMEEYNRQFISTSLGSPDQGWLLHNSQDYVAAVELALFNMTLSMPPPTGFITHVPPQMYGRNHQPVPGLPHATYTGMAGGDGGGSGVVWCGCHGVM